MTKLDDSFEPHLTVGELSLLPGGEWTPKLHGWLLIYVRSGSGYWMDKQKNQELGEGGVLVLDASIRGIILASRLSELSLCFYSVRPERLTGLLTLKEQRLLEAAESVEEFSPRFLPPQASAAGRMRELTAAREKTGAAYRLQLLQLFVELFGNRLRQDASEAETVSDAKDRLVKFLNEIPTSELLHLSFAELVRATRCTPRHLSRIFRDVAGMSFRELHAELRLTRACELLAGTKSKVVDVALESGYQSLSLFSLMFTRRFGLSPGKWRQKRQNGRVNQSQSLNVSESRFHAFH
jgi:AraC-like DNA-binding protein